MNHQVTRAARTRPASPATPKAIERGDLDLAHRGQLAGDEADRPDPVLVGAPHPVGVVVDVVRADLDTERHHQGQDARSSHESWRSKLAHNGRVAGRW